MTIGEHGQASSAARKMEYAWVRKEENGLNVEAALTAEGFPSSKEGPCSI
jgi:hypothetical protein